MKRTSKIYKNIKRAILHPSSLQRRVWKISAIIVLPIIGAVLIIILILFGYNFDITGFNSHTEIIKAGEQVQPAKTLWDWMQLLIVPAVLVIGGFILNTTINRNEQRIAQKRFELEHEVAVSARRESLIQTYFDKITELLIQEEALRKPGVRNVASARTIAVIGRLDEELQENLLHFLHNAGLIKNDVDGSIISLQKAVITNPVFIKLNLSYSNLKGLNIYSGKLYNANFAHSNLNEAQFIDCSLAKSTFQGASLIEAYLTSSDLSEANFSSANLYHTILAYANLKMANLTQSKLKEANLKGANMRGAMLVKADLSSANLTNADLTEADLTGADLSKADLRGANLTGANLTEANLQNAILDDKTTITQKQLQTVKQIP